MVQTDTWREKVSYKYSSYSLSFCVNLRVQSTSAEYTVT